MNQQAASSAESPWSVSLLNSKVKGWIQRLGHVWVEGELAQISTKPSWKLSYLTLRDVEKETSVQLTVPTQMVLNHEPPLTTGDRVVCYARPAFYEGRGSFSLWVTEIRHVGIGELLARIAQLRETLQREGLFAPERKQALPFLPNRIGLITGRGSAAERDVLAVSKDRWPEVDYRVINTAVQGSRAVPEIIDALRTLDEDESVDVIIIARGGGSVEDLLPFSEESLQRAVAAARTPVVSAIGHEPDTPILDNVADLRAATPTDAAKRVVPDVVAERQLLAEASSRLAQALRGWVARQEEALQALRSRPVLADPYLPITQREEQITQARERIRRTIEHSLYRAETQTASLRAQVTALGPAATLARGYAVVQALPRDGSDPEVVTSIEQAGPATNMRIRVADGSIAAVSMQTFPKD
ncbi:exodeoxyribonuclease VII large subunit [Corynebacterium sp. TAE3-ERU30]|uniref:exodeoxyribonuclease VII large subunit n=1 Tax=Corynebacterium sp. TAE3-ERU30 TaxID=2849496 RepID=UPI001C48BCFE|nr:exodeoxyribonuclease VII large subunit [Corynebacterium sp. TAE3-ERU30]MBV7281206.1 exodeoxyribonuclease VII large subunit [Corynebacterium sp. TAE3-ERU30]